MKYDFQISSPVNALKVCSVDTRENFKVAIISVSFALPLTGDISANALLPFMLKRTCKKHPTLTQMNRRLAGLYGAMVSAGVAKNGESQVLSLSVTALEDRFALSSERISSEATELLLDMIFDPSFENGEFLQADIEREKRL